MTEDRLITLELTQGEGALLRDMLVEKRMSTHPAYLAHELKTAKVIHDKINAAVKAAGIELPEPPTK
jgi:hypothetical protein